MANEESKSPSIKTRVDIINEYTNMINNYVMGRYPSYPDNKNLKRFVSSLICGDVYEIYQTKTHATNPMTILKRFRSRYWPKHRPYDVDVDIIKVMLSRISRRNRCPICAKKSLPKSLFCADCKGFKQCEYKNCENMTIYRGDNVYCDNHLHKCTYEYCKNRDTFLLSEKDDHIMCSKHSYECSLSGCSNRISTINIKYCKQHTYPCLFAESCSSRVSENKKNYCNKKHELVCKLEGCNERYDPINEHIYSLGNKNVFYCCLHYSMCEICKKTRIRKYIQNCTECVRNMFK